MSHSESDSLFTGAALAVGCLVTFVVTLIATAIITFFVTFTCVKKFFQDASGKQKVATTNALVYDAVGQPNQKQILNYNKIQLMVSVIKNPNQFTKVAMIRINNLVINMLYVVTAIILYPF